MDQRLRAVRAALWPGAAGTAVLTYTGPPAPVSQHGPCRGKRIWPSKGVATKQAKRTRSQGGGRVMETYHCTSCHGWHVGGSIVGSRLNRRPRINDNLEDDAA